MNAGLHGACVCMTGWSAVSLVGLKGAINCFGNNNFLPIYRHCSCNLRVKLVRSTCGQNTSRVAAKWQVESLSVGAFSSDRPHTGFSLWTWEESSTGCLSAVPWCLEKAHGLFNSQPIFCPSHHFIPTSELSSGPHTVTFLTHLAAYTSTIPENIVSSSPPPAHFQYEQHIKIFKLDVGAEQATLPPHTSSCVCVWRRGNHM